MYTPQIFFTHYVCYLSILRPDYVILHIFINHTEKVSSVS